MQREIAARTPYCGFGAAGSSPTGRKAINGGAFYKEAYYMAANIELTASAGAGTLGTFLNTPIRVDSDADFEVQKIMFQSTSPSVIARIRSSKGEYLMPENTDLQAFAGTQFDAVGPGTAVSWFTPYILSQPYRFPMSSDIIIEAADYSGATNTVRVCMWGAKVWCGRAPWDNPKYKVGQPIFRSTERQSIAANGSQVLTVNMDSDADVLVRKIMATRTAGALVSVTEGARGRDWGNRATHIDNIAGSGQFPHKLSAGRFVPVNSSMTFQVQDISGSPNVIEIILECTKYHRN